MLSINDSVQLVEVKLHLKNSIKISGNRCRYQSTEFRFNTIPKLTDALNECQMLTSIFNIIVRDCLYWNFLFLTHSRSTLDNHLLAIVVSILLLILFFDLIQQFTNENKDRKHFVSLSKVKSPEYSIDINK